MDYLTKISTPANTHETAPKLTTIQLTRGRITGGFIAFPPGPAGTLNVVLKIASHQIAPYNLGQAYALNACIVDLSLNIDLKEPPFSLDVWTWNTSTSYAHEVTVAIFLSPRKKNNKTMETLQDLFAGVPGYRKP